MVDPENYRMCRTGSFASSCALLLFIYLILRGFTLEDRVHSTRSETLSVLCCCLSSGRGGRRWPGGGGGGRSLEETPTWVVAVVCFLLVLVSILIERSIHTVGEWLKKKQKRALLEALEKMKSELMLLGFISLLLTVGRDVILAICISEKLGTTMLPCKKPSNREGGKGSDDGKGKSYNDEVIGRKLLWSEAPGVDFRRILAGGGGGSHKCAKGKMPLISSNAINQLHIFIFVLAVFHVIYCITTMALGRAKMRRWKVWEQECKTMEYQFSHDPERFRFARETTFGRRHLHFWSRIPVLIWIVCFFRQFVRSVPKVDYQTLRHGFIMAHLAAHSTKKFDFQKYIKRSLEDDFKVVVGISPIIWFFAVFFFLFYARGSYSYYWLPFIPLFIILLVGTKLQVVITRMGLEIQGEGEVIKGVPVVRPADHLFWFNRPRLILYIIHFVLFQNAFQVALFVWAWSEFGLHSCFHKHKSDIIIRLSMGILIQILCSYVTLPLYALVTQMGTNMRPTIFDERVANALRRWHNAARKHIKESRKLPPSSSATSPATTPGRGSSHPSPLSPMYLLRHGRRREEEPSSSRSTNHRRHDEGSSSRHYRRHDEVEQTPSFRNESELQKIDQSAAAQQSHDVDRDSKNEFSFEKSGNRTQIGSGGSS